MAAVLIEGFDKHYRLFRATSARAKERFEAGAWAEAQQAVQERIRFYDERVRECVERLHGEFDVGALERPDLARGEALLHRRCSSITASRSSPRPSSTR